MIYPREFFLVNNEAGKNFEASLENCSGHAKVKIFHSIAHLWPALQARKKAASPHQKKKIQCFATKGSLKKEIYNHPQLKHSIRNEFLSPRGRFDSKD